MPSSFAILIAARDEEERIGDVVAGLTRAFPDASIVVADDGSIDGTAERARAAGATVLPRPRLGKGEALTAAERGAPPGPVLLCDADLEGDLHALVEAGGDLAIAEFAERAGGGFGIAKQVARRLIRARAGLDVREPLSGQRFLSERARSTCFPLARGFGCELRMTVDAVRAGLEVREVRLPLAHRRTGRDLRGFSHRARQLLDATLAAGPLATNYRGNRLPLVGALVALAGLAAPRRVGIAVTAVAAAGLADDLLAGAERGWREHLRGRSTTGVLKLAVIPAAGLVSTRSVSGALLVGLSANALNLLDTRPGRALEGFLAASIAAGRPAAPYAGMAVLLLPYDLKERVMLGDAGANALGAVVGLSLVAGLGSRGRWLAVVGLAGLNALGDRASLGSMIERTPGLSWLDGLGRIPE